jgi:hypothetical protein
MFKTTGVILKFVWLALKAVNPDGSPIFMEMAFWLGNVKIHQNLETHVITHNKREVLR